MHVFPVVSISLASMQDPECDVLVLRSACDVLWRLCRNTQNQASVSELRLGAALIRKLKQFKRDVAAIECIFRTMSNLASDNRMQWTCDTCAHLPDACVLGVVSLNHACSGQSS